MDTETKIAMMLQLSLTQSRVADSIITWLKRIDAQIDAIEARHATSCCDIGKDIDYIMQRIAALETAEAVQ